MYEFFHGKVVACAPTSAVIDVGGVGYALTVPVSTYERLRKAHHDGAPIRLLARLQLSTKQDDLRLFGFATDAERRLFDALVKVQGIGPASALAVLSGSSPGDVVRAIRDGDTSFLTRVKGIGKKTAARVVVELGEKAHLLMPPPEAEAAVDAETGDAVRALVSLGYTPTVARKAVDKAAGQLGGGAAVQDIVRAALRHV